MPLPVRNQTHLTHLAVTEVCQLCRNQLKLKPTNYQPLRLFILDTRCSTPYCKPQTWQAFKFLLLPIAYNVNVLVHRNVMWEAKHYIPCDSSHFRSVEPLSSTPLQLSLGSADSSQHWPLWTRLLPPGQCSYLSTFPMPAIDLPHNGREEKGHWPLVIPSAALASVCIAVKITFLLNLVPRPCCSAPKASVPVVIVVHLLDCPSFQYCTSLPWSMIPLSLPPVLQGKFCSFDHAMQQAFLSYTWSVTE